MASWLSNPWVIGIGGGLLSGLLVTTISRFLLSRRENREYLQKVAAANQEMLYAIRPGISDGKLPNRQTVLAMTVATARRHAVDVKDLFTAKELSQELIKEVMDSSFLTAESKHNYCEQLGKLDGAIGAPVARVALPEEKKASRSELAEYREKMTRLTSMMMGVLAMAMTAFLAFYMASDRGISPLDNRLTILLPAVLSLVVVLATTAAMFLRRELSERQQEKRRETGPTEVRMPLESEPPAQPGAEADG